MRISFLLATVSYFAAGVATGDEVAKQVSFFETRIRPVLIRECYECHSHAAVEPKGELRLDYRDGLLRGGESGPAIVPGDPEASLLILAVRHDGIEMPPKKPLAKSIVQDFVKWISDGAIDPRDNPPSAPEVAAQIWQEAYEHRLQWWSLQSLTSYPVASEAANQWTNGPADCFIAAKLHEHGFQPQEQAARRILARRLSQILIGLPPSVDEVNEFLTDRSPDALERYVDRLLASPHYGEHWARHWMDVVRYTDTYGYEWDIPAKGAWRYRDYLTRAFNEDVPFDQIVREQIAGDLLEQPRINGVQHINESMIGPMFYQMGEKRHGDSSEFNGVHQEMLDNKIDAFSKAFQALTVSCARCHDHKLDAVSQRDYYALAGSFMSSRWVTNTVDTPRRNQKLLDELKSIKSALRPILASDWLSQAREFSPAIQASLTSELTADDENVFHQLLAKNEGKALPIEDPLNVIQSLAGKSASITSTWSDLAKKYNDASTERTNYNKTHVRVIADFRDGIPDGWSVDGVGLRDIVHCGDIMVALDGDHVIRHVLPGGLCTASLSPKLNGSIRTPYTTQFETGHISFECFGGDFAASRTVVDNAFLTEKQQYITSTTPGWRLMSTLSSKKKHHVYIEYATKTSNPNFPPRVGLGGECTDEQIADPRSWFGLTRVAVHNSPLAPKEELLKLKSLFAAAAPSTHENAAKRIAAWFQLTLIAWQEDRATADDVQLINWMLSKGLLNNSWTKNEKLGELVRRYRKLESQLTIPWTVNGMADVDPGYDYRLNIRGDYDQLGDAVPRGYVLALAKTPSNDPDPGSGRRQLAELIASPENPLTARVFVNRVWQWLFGTGLVVTSNDFGHLGELPSHPELLDYLAAKFIRNGWSTKKLTRDLVLSQTWRQASVSDTKATEADPRNRLLHHYPQRRMQAEAIRDTMLAASGRLNRRLFGPPIDPSRPSEDRMKRLFSGPVDGNGRRSIYTKITIMEPPKLLASFNQPDPKIPTGRRDVTNTPVQSLALLNDPFVVSQAEHWGRRMAHMTGQSVDDRICKMFAVAYSRQPTESELTRWCDAIADLTGLSSNDSEMENVEIAVWTHVAHTLFNSKEFIYLP